VIKDDNENNELACVRVEKETESQESNEINWKYSNLIQNQHGYQTF